MILQVRMLLLGACVSAPIGVLGGLCLGMSQIRSHEYLDQGLWRTALGIISHDSMLGAVAGAAGGILMAASLVFGPGSLAAFRARPESQSAGSSSTALSRQIARLIVSFGACAMAAMLLIPGEAPEVLGISHRLAAAICIIVLWFALKGDALASLGLDGDHRAEWSEFLWSVVVFLACLVALAHLWARVDIGWWTGGLTSAGLLVAAAIYSLLRRSAAALIHLLSRIFDRPLRLLATRWTLIAILTCAAILWCGAWATALRSRARASESGRNLIIIAVDTLREDGVSLLSEHEHGRDLTPHLRKLLAPRATIFSRAFSQAPWTLPAFASIFTGIYPEQHGAEHVASQVLPAQLTLAEILREAGYLTMSVVSGHFVSSEVGMTQGFTLYDDSRALSFGDVTSPEVTDKALALLADHRDEPFFLFVHYFDPHAPYHNHTEFKLPTDRAWRRSDDAGWFRRRGPWSGRSQVVLEPDEQAAIRAFYDEEIAYTDLHIGRLLAFLDENELWESTCVVFVADHGEEFLDHGSGGHGRTLFRELIHVPLLIADPSRHAPAVIADPVETRWLFGTILEMLGIRPPDERVPLPTLFSSHHSDGYPVRSSTRGGSKAGIWLSGLLDNRHHIIKDHIRNTVMLFDLLEDPEQLADLSDERPELAKQLSDSLEKLNAEVGKTAQVQPMPPLTEDQLRRLRDLGYL